MNQQRLLELATRRGELTATIAMQRSALQSHMRPLLPVFGVADRAVDGAHWLRRHPWVVGVALAVVAIARPVRAWRWGKRAFFLWRGWKNLRTKLIG